MLFDKNGFYLPEDYNQDYDFAINIIDGSYNDFKIYNLDEGLKYGNLFPSLYEKYKNYCVEMPEAYTSEEKMILDIQKLEFAINDLNLYLDLHPENVYANQIFNDYIKECNHKKKYYNKTYGPITLDQTNKEYKWSSSNWPWEGSNR